MAGVYPENANSEPPDKMEAETPQNKRHHEKNAESDDDTNSPVHKRIQLNVLTQEDKDNENQGTLQMKDKSNEFDWKKQR